MDINNILKIKTCTGCGSCIHHCPVMAIQMNLDVEGFLAPQVNMALCTECGNCLIYCPVMQTDKGTPCNDTCIAINAPDSYRSKSASGGIFPYIAEAFINNGGYISGAVYKDTLSEGVAKVEHIVSNKPEDLERMRSSKYVQSDTHLVYPEIKKLLDKNIPVFFSGCACQNAGLKAFLGKDYPYLFTADVICYGTPSPKVFSNYIKYFYYRYGPIEEIDFRKKSEFGWDTGMYIKFKSGHVISEGPENPYLKGFLEGWFMRKCCHTCDFKSEKYSDITIGDFWGIDKLNPSLSDKKGTSYVEINTEKGKLLYDRILSNIENQETYPVEAAIRENDCLRKPLPETEKRSIFFEHYI